MSCGKNWITAFKVKVTAKVQNVSVCLAGWYLLNCRMFCYQTWYGVAASWARVSCGKKFVCYFQGQDHSKCSFDQNMTLSTMSSELLISWQPNLVWWYIIISWFVKRIGILHLRSRSQWRVKMSIFVQMISSKLPNILLPNLLLWCIFMNQSACKKTDLLFLRSRSQQGAYDQNVTVSTSSELLPNLVWSYIIISQSVLWRS